LLLGEDSYITPGDKQKLVTELSSKTTNELLELLEKSPEASATRVMVSRLILERSGLHSNDVTSHLTTLATKSLSELYHIVSNKENYIQNEGYSEYDIFRAGQILDDTLLRLASSNKIEL
jgi:hypothetical protein